MSGRKAMANRVSMVVLGVLVLVFGSIGLFVIPGAGEKLFEVVTIMTGAVILLYAFKVKFNGEPLKSYILYFAFGAMPVCKALISINRPFLLVPVLIHGGLAVLIIGAGILKLKESLKSAGK